MEPIDELRGAIEELRAAHADVADLNQRFQTMVVQFVQWFDHLEGILQSLKDHAQQQSSRQGEMMKRIDLISTKLRS